ncbi:serine/threonine-protein kinase [Mycobacterium celatum]|uniref:non-specific serine/threonine protein kinase n=1 Tax=Mycobacterium celatum TaxID=28045 RepID=A0A1X1RWG2_MYCCE|nr:serine/threonine-protein kinase [Mycobacterium celatum]ORV19140.1 serine/threonine protein kinase [Mycobacterium celatum]PIB78252.1 serine/threonine protein kinase [Mycobacterium celatum]
MPLRNGEVFAGYTILRLLGSGGMGEVYLAQHPRLPRRDALKVLPANLTADHEFRQRFNREADVAARLSHPHIVGVHDRGEFREQLWISMDHVEGTDAAEMLRSRYPSGMPHEEVVEIVSAVADALDYAHSQGLLHRDVKPANILLGQPSHRGRQILLADFGIARQLGDVSGLTATNMMIGTTAYAAPEQLRGANLDGRTDQYALGCTTFHLLTGSAPFQHSNPAVVITQHLSEPPPRIGDRRPELAGLNDVLARALAKDPDERYPSCSDFAAALGGAAPPESPATVQAAAFTAPSPPRRHFRPAVLVSVIAAIVLVAVAVVLGEQLVHRQSSQPSDGVPTAPAPALQLSRYITDQSGVLAAPGRAAVERAINKLYNNRHVRLWVVYVNNFGGLRPVKWAEDIVRANGLTDTDALLAIATDDRHFSFRVPGAVTNGTAIDVEAIRRGRIEPAVARGEWARAAVVAAEGLENRAG